MKRQRIVRLLRAEAARRRAIALLDGQAHLPEHEEVAEALEEAATILQKERAYAAGRKKKNQAHYNRKKSPL